MGDDMKYGIRFALLLATGVLSTLPTTALAGGKAALAAGGNTLHIAWRDAETLRMETGDDSSYFIMRDGKAYSVTQAGGTPRVMDMAAMMQMMRAMGGQSAPQPAPDSFGSVGKVEATGATETVAGIKGRVYRMTWTDPDGSKHSGEAVLTDDPLAVQMTSAYLGSVTAMFGSDNSSSFQSGLPGKDRGLLRVGDSFQVTSISRTDPPASAFELPAEPMDMSKMFGGKARH